VAAAVKAKKAKIRAKTAAAKKKATEKEKTAAAKKAEMKGNRKEGELLTF